jgi:hypothetical protein
MEVKIAYTSVSANPAGKDQLGNLDVDDRTI